MKIFELILKSHTDTADFVQQTKARTRGEAIEDLYNNLGGVYSREEIDRDLEEIENE